MRRKGIVAIVIGLIMSLCMTVFVGCKPKDDPVPPAPVEYAVTFNANGGAFADGTTLRSQKVNDGEYATLPAAPSHPDGYEFLGWGVANDSTTTVDVTSIKVTANTTYYAVWETAPPPITIVEITATVSKTRYVEGESFDPDTVIVTATYSNDTHETLGASEYTITPPADMTASDTPKTVTVTLNGTDITTTFNIKVVAPDAVATITSISAVAAKTEYTEDEEFDASTVTVTAIYSDNTHDTLDASKYTITLPTDMTASDTPKTVTVTLKGTEITATFTITVSAAVVDPTITSISAVASKTEYIEGERFDVTTVTVTATYNNGTSDTLTPSKYTITLPTDMTASDTPKTVTVTLKGSEITATFTITVIPVPATKYTVTFNYNYTGAPDSGVYLTDDTVEEGTSVTKPTDPTRTGYNFVNWFKEASCTNAFSFSSKINADTVLYAKWAPAVTALNIGGALRNPTQYVGDTFDHKNLTFSAVYGDGHTASLDLEKDGIAFAATDASFMNASGKLLRAGNMQVVFTYSGVQSRAVSVTVVEKPSAVPDGEYLLGSFNSNVASATYKATANPFSGGVTYEVGGASGISVIEGDEFRFATYTDNTPAPHSATGTTITVRPAAMTVTVDTAAGKYKITHINSDVASGKWYVRRVQKTGQPDELVMELVGFNALRDPKNAGNTVTKSESYAGGKAYLSGNFTDNYNPSEAWSTPITGGAATFSMVYLKKYDSFKVVIGGSSPAWYGVAVTRVAGQAARRNAARSAVSSLNLSTSGDEIVLSSIEDGYYDITVNVSGDSGTLSRSAHENTVTFNKNTSYDVTSLPAAAKTDLAGKITKPANPALKGFTFVGWFREPACATAFDFTKVVTEDVTVYAKWTAKTYTIVYGNTDTAVSNGSYTANSSGVFEPLTLTAVGQKAHYHFEKWQIGGVDKDAITYADIPATGSAITLTARYTGDKFAVSFKNDDGTPFTAWAVGYSAPTEHEYGVSLALPTMANVNIANAVFIGWYAQGDTSKTTVTTVAANDASEKVFVVKCSMNAVRVSFDLNYEGKTLTPANVEVGSTVAKPQDPVREGWHFDGWFKDAAGATLWNFASDTVSTDITLYAKWTRNPQVLTGITLNYGNVKVDYVDGQAFDPTGLVVTAHYDYGDPRTLSASEYTLSIPAGTVLAISEGATRQVTVNHNQKTAQFNLTVVARNVDSVALTGSVIKSSYYTEDTFDPTGLEFTVTYNDGTVEHPAASEITYTADGLVAKAFTKAGSIQITASYGGVEASAKISVTVTQLAVSSLAISGKLEKTQYNRNDAFDPTGLTFTATYNNGSTREIDANEVSFTSDSMTGNTLTKEGDASISASYGGKTAPTAISVTVYVPNTLAKGSWYLLGTFNGWGANTDTAKYVLDVSTVGGKTVYTANYFKLAAGDEFKIAKYDNDTKAGTDRFAYWKNASSVGVDPVAALLNASIITAAGESNGNVKIGAIDNGVKDREWIITYTETATSIDVNITLDYVDFRGPMTGEHKSNMDINSSPDADVYLVGNFSDNFKTCDDWSDKNEELVYTRTVGSSKVYYFIGVRLKQYDSFKVYVPSRDKDQNEKDLRWLGGSFVALDTGISVSADDPGNIYLGTAITDGVYNLVFDAATDTLTIYAAKSLTVEVSGVFEGKTPTTSNLVVKHDGHEVISGYELVASAATAGDNASSVTVIYKGSVVTETYTAKKPVINSIAVTTQPAFKEHYVGDSLKTDGLVITATYDSGDTAVLDPADYTVTSDIEAKTTAVTTQTDKFAAVGLVVTVTLKSDTSKTCPITDMTLANRATSLTVVQNKTYFEGDTPQKSDFTVTVNFNGGTEVTQAVADFTWGPDSSLAAGENTVNFTHGSLTQPVVVNATKIVPVEITFERIGSDTNNLLFRTNDIFKPIADGQYNFFVKYNNSETRQQLADSTKLTFVCDYLDESRFFTTVSELTTNVEITVRFTDKDTTVTADAKITVDVDIQGDLTFRLVYDTGLPAAYTVTGMPESTTVRADADMIARPADPVAKGFTFVNWVNKENNSLISWPLDVRSNVKIKANWTAVTYTVTYDVAGGTHSGNPMSYTATENSGLLEFVEKPLTNASKQYYTANGWYDKPQAEVGGNRVTALNYAMLPASGTEIKLYAYWTAITYTVIYDVGDYGSIDVVDNQKTFTIETVSTIATLPVLTLNAAGSVGGYRALGWYTARDGGNKYEHGLSAADIPAEGTEFTVYARYSNLYKVTFDANGGTLAAGSSAEVDVVYNTAVTKPDDPARDSNTFKGWYLVTGGAVSDTEYDFATHVTADITLRALWTANPKNGTYLRGDMNNWGEGATAYEATVNKTDSSNPSIVTEYKLTGVPLKLNDAFQLGTYDNAGNLVNNGYFKPSSATIDSHCKPDGYVTIGTTSDSYGGYNYKVTNYDAALEGRTWTIYVSRTMVSIELEPDNIMYSPDGTRVENPTVVTVPTADVYIRGGFTAKDYGMTADWSSDSTIVPTAKTESGVYYFSNVSFRRFQQFKLYFKEGDKWSWYGGSFAGITTSGETKWTALANTGAEGNLILYDAAEAGAKYDLVFDSATKTLALFPHKNLTAVYNTSSPVYVGRTPKPANFTNIVYGGASMTTDDITVVGAAAAAGANTASVICGNTVYKVSYTATAVVAQRIEVTTLPTKKDYNVGDTFAPAGMVVTVYYNDPEKTLELDDTTQFTVAALPLYANVADNFAVNNAQRVKLEVKATIDGAEHKTTVAIMLKNVLTGIEVTPPEKLAYYQGNDMVWAGFKVTAVFNKFTDSRTGTEIRQDLSSESGYVINDGEPIDMNAAGKRTIKVEFKPYEVTFEASFDIEITELELTGITVDTTDAKKLTYKPGEAVDYTGIVVTAAYNDPNKTETPAIGTAATVTFPEGVYADGMFKKAGTHTLTVTYNGKTDTFTVTVSDLDVTFESNGGSHVASVSVSNYGGEITAPAPAPTKDHYDFAGWFKDEKLTSAFDFDTDTITEDTTLYAKWTPKTYTVTFNKNATDASGTQPQNVVYNTKATRPTDPTRQHFTFGGWYTSATPAEGDNAFDFDNTVITGDITLYAKWTNLPVYEVTFDSDGGSAVSTQNVESNSKAKEPTAPTKTGYTFSEWRRNGVKYDFDTPVTSNVALKAVWTINKYTLTFTVDGDTFKTVNNVEYNASIASHKPATDPTKTGYTFSGWYNGESEWNFTTGRMPAENLELKAVFTVNEYDLVFITNNGVSNDPVKTAFGADITLPDVGTREGYDFVRWYYVDGANNVTWTAGTMPANDLTLIVEWKKKTYTVTFDANAGDEATSPESKTIEHGATVARPADPARTGYALAGWYTKNGAGNVWGEEWKFGTGGNTVTGDVTLYAKWTKNNYTVSFSLNTPAGATAPSGIAPITVPYKDTALSNKPADPAIVGYTFDGWFVGETEYKFNEEVTANVELKAKWTLITYTVTYTIPHGDRPEADPVEYNVTMSPVTLAAPVNIAEGWYFVKWLWGDEEVTALNKSMIDAATTGIALTAVFDNHYNVVFDANGGSFDGNAAKQTVSVVYDTAVAKPADPTRSGNTFDGWYTVAAPGATDTAYNFTTPVKGALTLYAKWRVNPTNGTFVLGTMNDWGAGAGYTAASAGTDYDGNPQYLVTGLPLENGAKFYLETYNAAGNKTGDVKPASSTIKFYCKPAGKVTIGTIDDGYGRLNYYVSAYDAGLVGKTWKMYISKGMVSLELEGTRNSRLPDGTPVDTPDVTTTLSNNVYIIGDFTDGFKLMDAWSDGSSVMTTAHVGNVYYFGNVHFEIYDQFKIFVPNDIGNTPDDKWSEKGTWYSCKDAFALDTAMKLTSEGSEPDIYINHASGNFDIVFDSANKTLKITEHKAITLTPVAEKPVYVGREPMAENFTFTYKGAAATPVLVEGAAAVSGVNRVKVVCGDTVQVLEYTATDVVAVGLEVTVKDSNKTYYVGDAVTASDITVNVVNNDGTKELNVGLGRYSFTQNVPASAVGTDIDRISAVLCDITVKLDGSDTITNTFKVSVKNRLTSIAVTTPPTKTEYVQYNTANYTGMVVTAYFNGGTAISQVIGSDLYTVSPADGAQLATVSDSIEVTVTLKADESITDSFHVKVTAPVIVSIAVTGDPSKTTYKVGDTFDYTGMTFTATYNNGTSDTLTGAQIEEYVKFTCDGFNGDKKFKAAGTSVIVKAESKKNGVTVTGSATVTVENKLTSIAITTMPTPPSSHADGYKDKWIEGDTFSSAGMVISAKYNEDIDGATVVTTADITSGFTVDKDGVKLTSDKQTVTVTYNGVTTAVEIDVIARTYIKVVMSGTPDKTTYTVGEVFASGGLTFTASYNDGTTGAVPGTDITFESASFNAAKQLINKGIVSGEDTVTAKYGDMTVVDGDGNAVEIQVTVNDLLTSIEVTTLPVPAAGHAAGHENTWIVGDKLGLTGMEITCHYNDGIVGATDDPKPVTSGFACTSVGTELVAGENVFTVTYGGKSATLRITPAARQVVGFTVTGNLVDQNTRAAFNPSGLTYTALWNDGKTETLTADKVTYESSYLTTNDGNELVFKDDSYTTDEETRKVTIKYLTFSQDVNVKVINSSTFSLQYSAHLPEGTTDADATGLPEVASVLYGQVIALDAAPTLKGYTFDGWYTTGDYTERVTTVTITGSRTVHAKWTAKAYKIRYDGITRDDDDFNAVDNVFGTLPLVDGAKAHHTFGGWYLKSDLSGDPVTNVTYNTIRTATVTVDGGNNVITLYAKFDPVTYHVTFIYGDGVTAALTKDVTYSENATFADVRPADPTRIGFNFGGWEGKDGNLYDFSTKVTGDITLSARWTVATFTVTFYNGADQYGETQTINHNNKATRPATDPTKASTNTTVYTFKGWYTSATPAEGATAFDFDNTGITENVTLYAVYTESVRMYTVTFDSKSGSSVASQSVQYQQKVTRPTDPTRTGYTFGGWFTEDACNNEYSFDTPVTESRTLYANWTKNKYTVSFDVNAYVGMIYDTLPTVASNTVEHGTTMKAPAAPHILGYTFGGWYKESSCANAWSFGSDTVTDNVTLYAKWTAINYTLAYDMGGKAESITSGSFTIENMESVSLPASVSVTSAAAASGWYFTDWYAAADGNTKFALNEAALENAPESGVITAYAHFSDEYTVTFDVNKPTGVTSEVTGMPEAVTVHYNTAVTETVASPKLTGYAFVGWYKDAACTAGREFMTGATGAKVTANITVYAKWQQTNAEAGVYLLGTFNDWSIGHADIANYKATYSEANNNYTVTGVRLAKGNTLKFVEYKDGNIAYWDPYSRRENIYGTGGVLKLTVDTASNNNIKVTEYNAVTDKDTFTVIWGTDKDGKDYVSFVIEYRDPGNTGAGITTGEPVAGVVYIRGTMNDWNASSEWSSANTELVEHIGTKYYFQKVYLSAKDQLKISLKPATGTEGWYGEGKYASGIAGLVAVTYDDDGNIKVPANGWYNIVFNTDGDTNKIEIYNWAQLTATTLRTPIVGQTPATSDFNLKAGGSDVSGYTLTAGAAQSGENTVTFIYRGGVLRHTYTAEEIAVTGGTVKTQPTNRALYVGDGIDFTGLVLTLTKNNGTTEDYTYTADDENGAHFAFTCVGYNGTMFLAAGEYTVSMTYDGKSAGSFTVNVANLFTGISIDIAANLPDVYQGGDQPDLKPYVTVYKQFNQGIAGAATVDRVQLITAEMADVTLSALDMAVATEQTVTVTYNGKTATFKVTVLPKAITGISISHNPTKLNYEIGDAFDPTDIAFTATYNNGKTEPFTGAVVYTSDAFRTGTTTFVRRGTDGSVVVKATYNTFTVDVNVTVANKLTGIEVTPKADAPTVNGTLQFVQDLVDFNFGSYVTVNLVYNGGIADATVVKTAITGYTNDLDITTVGEKTVTVTASGKTATITVKVVAPELTGVTVAGNAKKEYLVGDSFDTAGLTFTGIYNNGRTAALTFEQVNTLKADGVLTFECSANGFNSSKQFKTAGNAAFTVTIKYKVANDNYVTVKQTGTDSDYAVSGITVYNRLTSIAVTTDPSVPVVTYNNVNYHDATNWVVGDALSFNGMKITLTYNTGVSGAETVTVEKAFGSEFSTSVIAGTILAAGTTTVNVTYAENRAGTSISRDASFTITPIAKVMTHLLIEGTAAAQNIQNPFNKNGLTFWAIYNNGDMADITNDAGLDFTTAGLYEGGKFVAHGDNKVVTVSYGGKTATVTVNVGNDLKFDVTFVANNPQGTVSGLPGVQSVNNESTATEPTTDPTLTGYTFGGWYTTAECTKAFNFNTKITAVTDVYAKWTAKSYKIRYDGITRDDTDYTAANNVFGTVTVTDGTKTHYSFKGWYYDAAFTQLVSGNSVDYSALSHAEVIDGVNVIKLYAKFEAVTYTVTFDTKGGSTIDPVTVTYAENATIGRPDDNPTKPGYVFDGWYTDDTYTTLHDFEAAITGNVTVVAKWAIEHTVTFDPRNGSSATTVKVKDGDAVAAPDPAPTYTGSAFAGWYLKTGENTTAANAYVFTTAVTDNITLVAKWNVTVTFMNGENTVATETVERGGDVTLPAANGLTAPDVSKEFDCWVKDGDVEFTGKDVMASVTVSAKWKTKKFTVSFDVTTCLPDGATAPTAPAGETVDYGETAARFVPTTPSASVNASGIPGYAFDGWYLKTGDTIATEPYDFTTPVTSNVTLVAKWKMTVSFDVTTCKPDGATAPTAPATVTVDYKGTLVDRVPADPSIAGYTFNGWYLKTGVNTTAATAYSFTEEVKCNITLVAKWTIKTYTVKFDVGEGTNHADNPNTYEVTDGTVTLKDPTPPSGKRFVKWTAGEGGETYTEIKLSDFTTSDTLNLVAVYESDTFTVTFNLNGGNVDGNTANITATVTNGEAIGSSAVPAPAKLRYNFSGWKITSPTGNNTLYTSAAVAEMKPSAATTFTAQWTAKTFTNGVYVDDTKVGDIKDNGSNTSEGLATVVVAPGQIVGFYKGGWLTFSGKTGGAQSDIELLESKDGGGVKLASGKSAGAYNFYYKYNGSNISTEKVSGYVAPTLQDGDGVYIGTATTPAKAFVLNLGNYNAVMATGITVGTGSSDTTRYSVKLKYGGSYVTLAKLEYADGIAASLSSDTIYLFAGSYDFYYSYAADGEGNVAKRLYIAGSTVGNPNSGLTYTSAGTNNAAFITGNVKLKGKTSFDWDNGFKMTSSGYAYTIKVYLTKGDVVKVRVNYNNNGTGLGYDKIQGTKPTQVSDAGGNDHNIIINTSGYYSFKAEWSDNPQQITSLTYSAT